jgi:uncharacterized protein (TIGR02231 family)
MIKGLRQKNKVVDDDKSYPEVIPALLIFFFLFSSPLSAAPDVITLYPQSALVTEVTKVRLQPAGKDFRKSVFTIPGQADPASLRVHAPQDARLKLEGLTWRHVKRNEDEKTKALRKQIKQLKEDRNDLDGLLHGLDTQIQFWQQQTKARAKTPAEAGVLSAAIGKSIRKAFQEKLNRQPELAELDKRIKELQQELYLSAEKNSDIWEANILLSGSAIGETYLTYSYTLAGCGWSPLYLLDARPQAGKISCAWKAEVWQNSGTDWKDVNMNLATGPAAMSLAPPDLAPWVIRPQQELRSKGKKAADKVKATSPASPTGIGRLSEDVSPPAGQGRSFTLLKAGKQTVPAGERHTINIREETWDADFGYLARPVQSPHSFVSASFHFPETREIPAGAAIFFLNGALLGKRNFALSGQEGVLFFGQDPLVTVDSQMLSLKADDKTSGKEKKFYHRQWRFEAVNAHTFPISLRIETPYPDSSDEKIKITLHHDPPPSEHKPALLIWKIDLPAGGKKSIDFGVELEASP